MRASRKFTNPPDDAKVLVCASWRASDGNGAKGQ